MMSRKVGIILTSLHIYLSNLSLSVYRPSPDGHEADKDDHLSRQKEIGFNTVL